MFNRVLQLRVIKANKDEPVKEINPQDLYAHIADAAGVVVKKVALAALAYVVVDTVRQVAVARAMNNS